MALEIGAVLDGKWEIRRLIGQGGMGAVYEGVHRQIDRRVAIKVLLSDQDPSANARFEQEARAAGRIGNDHILEVLDVGTAGKTRYMVSEFLEGETLAERIARLGKLTPEQLTPIAMQILTGLGAAHRAGIIHRDLKPANIFLLKEKAGRKDFVKLIDFGISKFTTNNDNDPTMTKTGMLLGTPYYISPEQARGRDTIDARADLYSVGVILYEALSGRLPFQANSLNDLLFKIVLEAPEPLDSLVPDLEPKFVAIVETAMAREVDARFKTALDFALAIDAWAKGDRPYGSRPSAPPAFEATVASPPTPTESPPSLNLAAAPTPTPGGLPPTTKRRGHRARWIGLSIGAATLLALGAGLFIYEAQKPLPGAPTEPARAAASPKGVHETNEAPVGAGDPASPSTALDSDDGTAANAPDGGTEDTATSADQADQGYSSGDATAARAVSRPAPRQPAAAPSPKPRSAQRAAPQPARRQRPPAPRPTLPEPAEGPPDWGYGD